MFKDRAILSLAIGQTLVWAGLYYVFPALLLRWEQELGWSKSDLTIAITLAVLISALFSPVAGKIIDRGRGAHLMAGSAICGGMCLIILSIVVTQWQFYAVWGIIGLAMSGCLYESCFALLTHARGKDAKRGIIVITLVAGFAGTISFPVTHVLSEVLGWRFATMLFGLIVIFVAAPMLWFGAHKLRNAGQESKPVHSPYKESQNNFLRKPAFWLLAIGFTLGAVVQVAALFHLLPLFSERGLSSEIAVYVASFIGPMQVAGRLAMMVSEKHVSHHSVTVGAYVSLGLSIIILLLSGSSIVSLSFFVILFGGSYGTIAIMKPLTTRDILGEQNFGPKSGALAMPYLAGSAIAPYLGSVIWEYGGYDMMLVILAVLSAAACTIYCLAHRLSEVHYSRGVENPFFRQ